MSQQDLRTYYNYLYPFDTLVNWLTYNGTTHLAHRQLSFQYEKVGVERYVVFNDAQAMKNRMISTREQTPVKVDAGAIWNRMPQKDSNAKTIQRELIFDFDMNDYDDIRTCCTGKTVCVKCWKLLTVAVEILEKALYEDFGFEKLMCVFSGGRGLHIWVCDKRARQLKDPVRKAIVDYMELVTGNDKASSLLAERVVSKVDHNGFWAGKVAQNNKQQIKKFYTSNYVNAHVERSLNIIRQYFLDIIVDQKIFQHDKCMDIMLKIIANRSEKLRDRIRDGWLKNRGRPEREMFEQMMQEILKFQTSPTVEDYNLGRTNQKDKIQRLTFIQEEIMLSFIYPRMDYNVSTMQNHLLKLPFSVHPSSKKVSIPLLKRQVAGFNPQKCCKIDDLLKDLDYEKLADKNEVNAAKSLLREPIEALEEFTKTLE